VLPRVYPLSMERAAWTDQRLDDLAEAMRSGFDRIDHDIRDLRVELRDGLGGVRTEIGAVRADIDALKTTLIWLGGAGIVTLLGVLAAILANS
jgi:hypothetical protein